MSSAATFHQGIYKSDLVRRVARWLDATPHPPVAIEIGLDSVAGARWTRTGGVDSYGVEPLPPGALVPSAVETNIVNPAALKTAVAEAVVEFLRPLQERYALLASDPGEVRAQLAIGAAKAEAMADEVVARARTATGLLPRS